MDTIKRFMIGASSPLSFHLRVFRLVLGRDIKILAAAVFILVGVILLYPSKNILKENSLFNLVSLYKVNISDEKLGNSELTESKVGPLTDKIDLKLMISQSMNYTFHKTEMGFFLKDPKFFKLYSKSQAEARILKTVPRRLAKNASKYLRAVLVLCEKHQVDPFWVFSVMWTESHFHFQSESIVGARGLMQIMPGTKKFIYRNVKRRGDTLAIEEKDFNLNEYFPYKVPPTEFKIHTSKLLNIELGIIYLKSLLNFFSKNHTYATVAYNMGPGWTRKRLRKKLPVGTKNEYLDKVQKAYKTMSHRI
jgi:hypothetical protein